MHTNPETRMTDELCTVDRVENTLVLMDADGTVLDIHPIAQRPGGRREAKRVINRWLDDCAFVVADAMNLV